MSAAASPNDGSRTLSEAQRLQAVCDRFERAWQAGLRPQLEDYLGDTPELERSALVRELIALEIAYRRKAGEQPQPDEYRARFPFLSWPSLVRSEDPRATSPEAPASAAMSLPEVPGYELLGELGRGGMGVVYRARHLRLNRLVALKMVLAGEHARPEDLLRFQAEAEAVAQLQHPHIVQVYEVSQHAGLPFFALEYLDGGSLAQKLQGSPLQAREAAQLVETLARAMQAAHERGIIHRDLKPANVLLDQEGRPKISDFGLAKRVQGGPGLTQTGAVLGTPSYMAPEQAAGHGKEVGAAADVYALGAILYELLTSRPPFKAATPLETVRQVLEEEPVSPRRLQPGLARDLETICLKCLAKDPHRRYGSAKELADDLGRWLAGEPIRARPTGSWERTLKWIKRRPAAALLMAVSGLAAVVLLAVVLSYNAQLAKALQDTTEAKRQTEAERDEAQTARAIADRERARAEDQESRAHRNLHIAHVNLIQRAWEEGHADRALELLRRHQQPTGRDVRGFAWYHFWHLYHRDRLTRRFHHQAVAFSPDRKSLALVGPDNTIELCDVATGKTRLTLSDHRQPVRCLAFSPDSKTLGSGAEDGQLVLWDVASGAKKAAFEVLTGPIQDGKIPTGPVVELTFAADGNTLAAKSRVGDQTTTTIWEVSSRAVKAFVSNAVMPGLSSDGTELALRDRDGTLLLINLARPARRRTLAKAPGGGVVTCEAFSPDGRLLAAGSSRVGMFVLGGAFEAMIGTHPSLTPFVSNVTGEVSLYEAASGQVKQRLRGQKGLVRCLAFSPDGSRLASGSLQTNSMSLGDPFLPQPGQLKLWNTETGQEIASLDQPGGVRSVMFSPDGRHVAFGAGAFGEVKLLDAATGQVRTTFLGHAAPAFALAFSADGQTLVSAGEDGTVKFWDVNLKPEPLLLPAASNQPFLRFTADSKTLASLSGWVTLTELASGKSQYVGGFADAADLSPDGKILVTGGMFAFATGKLTVWDLPVNKARLTMKASNAGGPIKFLSVLISPDRQTVATLTENASEVILWDLGTGKQRASLELDNRDFQIRSLAFSPTGLLLAAGSSDGVVTLCDTETGKRRTILREPTDLQDPIQMWAQTVTALAFSPDGQRLAVGHGISVDIPTFGTPSAVKLWDVNQGIVRHTLKGHLGSVRALAFSPDGQTLATAGDDSTVRLWDLESGQSLVTLRGGKSGFNAVAFSPDYRLLAASDRGGTVRVWHAATKEDIRARNRTETTGSN
jgi:WD40 repeat protein